MTFISWLVLLPRNNSIFSVVLLSDFRRHGSWLIQVASPCAVKRDTTEVHSSPFPLIAYKGLPLAAAIAVRDNLALANNYGKHAAAHMDAAEGGWCAHPSTPTLRTQCWLLGPSVLGMQGRADKEFEFLAGLSVKVIKPLLMHPFVVAVSSSVTFIKYVQLNVTERGSSPSYP